MKCVKECPISALNEEGYLGGMDKALCVSRSEELAVRGISPCGICIAVCPIGKKVTPPVEGFIDVVRKYEG